MKACDDLMTYPECLDGDGDVVPLPDGLVHVAILAPAQLVLHHDVRPARYKSSGWSQ